MTRNYIAEYDFHLVSFSLPLGSPDMPTWWLYILRLMCKCCDIKKRKQKYVSIIILGILSKSFLIRGN